MDITRLLLDHRDEQYALFQSKLTPGISPETIIGLRVPRLRQLAKQIISQNEEEPFLSSLPHAYYDENMLHALLICEEKNACLCFEKLETFLPYIDNWAVCDSLAPAVLKKHRDELLERIRLWTVSAHVYTCRFGIGMLMRYFLDAAFEPSLLDIPASVKSDEYYINMMIAWFYATALAKQWPDTVPYLERNLLSQRVHNKTIQKALESYRITPEQK